MPTLVPFFSPYGQMYDRDPEVILKELLQILKIVQLEYAINKHRRTIYHKHVLQLTLYIQEVFYHGLKRNTSLDLLKKVMFSSGKSECGEIGDESGGVSMWDVVQNITYPDGIKKIGHGLRNVKTGVGQGMAWIRLALNEGTLEDYVRILTSDKNLLFTYYRKDALLNDMEHAMVFESFLIGIRSMAFGLFVDDPDLDCFARGNFSGCENCVYHFHSSCENDNDCCSGRENAFDSGIGSNLLSDCGTCSPSIHSEDDVSSAEAQKAGTLKKNSWLNDNYACINNTLVNEELACCAPSIEANMSFCEANDSFCAIDSDDFCTTLHRVDSDSNGTPAEVNQFSPNEYLESSIIYGIVEEMVLAIEHLERTHRDERKISEKASSLEVPSSPAQESDSENLSYLLTRSQKDMLHRTSSAASGTREKEISMLSSPLSPKFYKTTSVAEEKNALSGNANTLISDYLAAMAQRDSISKKKYDVQMYDYSQHTQHLDPKQTSTHSHAESDVPTSSHIHSRASSTNMANSTTCSGRDNFADRKGSKSISFYTMEDEINRNELDIDSELKSCSLSTKDCRSPALDDGKRKDRGLVDFSNKYCDSMSKIGTYVETKGHTFVETQFIKPTKCDECSSIMWGLYKQGYQCSNCGYNCHKRCLNNIFKACALCSRANESFSLQICPERNGLVDQNFKCFKCFSPISLLPNGGTSVNQNTLKRGGKSKAGACVRIARLCDYSGKYYCDDCHWDDVSVIPARVIHNWDFSRRKVSREAKHFISSFMKKKSLNLEELNPLLFDHVAELCKCRDAYQELAFIDDLLYRCRHAAKAPAIKAHIGTFRRVAVASEKERKKRERGVLSEFDILFSLEDLCKVNDKRLLPHLSSIREAFLDHVTESCRSCIFRADFMVNGPKPVDQVEETSSSTKGKQPVIPKEKRIHRKGDSSTKLLAKAHANNAAKVSQASYSGVVVSHYLL
eukprot:Nk52_evm50s1020 gene=Nk52_evmTU50s1020